VIFRDASALKALVHTFEEDWAASSSDELQVEDREREDTRETRPRKVAKRIAKSVTRKISVTPVTKKIAKAITKTAENGANGRKVQKAAEAIAKDVVENTVLDAAKEAVKAVSDSN
jgi:histone H3/H4